MGDHLCRNVRDLISLCEQTECESSPLPRSVSDPLHEKAPELSRNSTEKGKDKHL